MIIIKNKIIPFKGFSAIYLFGLLFTKKELSRTEINHELIHERQAKEMLFVFFYSLVLNRVAYSVNRERKCLSQHII